MYPDAPEAPKPPAPAPAGLGSSLTNLLAGENGQKLIMALVILAGGGNLISTDHSSRVSQADLQRAITEIHTVHEALEPMMSRQKEMSEHVKDLYEHQVSPTPTPKGP